MLGPEHAGLPLRDVLRGRLKVSRTLYRKLWAADGVTLDGLEPEPFVLVKDGQTLQLSLLPSSTVDPEPTAIRFAHQDADCVVVDKPAGMVVHPTMGHVAGTLAGALAHHLGAFHLIQRLDMETSGLLVVARHPLAAQRLSLALARRTLKRSYHALVHGRVAREEGAVDVPIGRVPGIAKRLVLEDGQTALTRYRVMERRRDTTLVELELETGRTHQIRVHMAHLGHPVVGDDRYGPDDRAWPRLCLHARSVAFPHPMTGEALAFTSPWPLGELP